MKAFKNGQNLVNGFIQTKECREIMAHTLKNKGEHLLVSDGNMFHYFKTIKLALDFENSLSDKEKIHSYTTPLFAYFLSHK